MHAGGSQARRRKRRGGGSDCGYDDRRAPQRRGGCAGCDCGRGWGSFRVTGGARCAVSSPLRTPIMKSTALRQTALRSVGSRELPSPSARCSPRSGSCAASIWAWRPLVAVQGQSDSLLTCEQARGTRVGCSSSDRLQPGSARPQKASARCRRGEVRRGDRRGGSRTCRQSTGCGPAASNGQRRTALVIGYRTLSRAQLRSCCGPTLHRSSQQAGDSRALSGRGAARVRALHVIDHAKRPRSAI